MEASPDDPLIGVYVLSQFVYCPRAGICAFENRQEQEEGPDPVNLDYLPLYDLRQLHERLAANVHVHVWQLLGLLLVIAGSFYLTRRVNPDLALLGMATVPFLLWQYAPSLCDTVELLRRIRAHHRAVAREPDPVSDLFQPVHWCEMLKAGFMSVPYKAPLRHDSWKLEGRPWRVLRRGNLRIPVFFQSADDRKLHDKHLAKAAAYCFLLQAVEVAESPYALVLKEDSFAGVTVPYHPRTRKIFHDGLRQAREVIRSVTAGNWPQPPEESRCTGCPLGKPVPYEPGESENHAHGVPLPVLTLTGDGGRLCHSHCGDRFRWIPPHDHAKE